MIQRYAHGMTRLFLFSMYFSFSALADPPTVDQVRLPSYLGKWFEIARIPNDFQDQADHDFGPCRGTTAEYAQGEKNRIFVTNSCVRINSQGEKKIEVAHAVARVLKDSGGAKLKVNFTGLALLRWLGIGDGNYWILALGPIDSQTQLYSWALVGGPDEKYGWILSRTPQLSSDDGEKIWRIAEKLGYRRTDFKLSP